LELISKQLTATALITTTLTNTMRTTVSMDIMVHSVMHQTAYVMQQEREAVRHLITLATPEAIPVMDIALPAMVDITQRSAYTHTITLRTNHTPA
jgi:hypothetical protein